MSKPITVNPFLEVEQGIKEGFKKHTGRELTHEYKHLIHRVHTATGEVNICVNDTVIFTIPVNMQHIGIII